MGRRACGPAWSTIAPPMRTFAPFRRWWARSPASWRSHLLTPGHEDSNVLVMSARTEPIVAEEVDVLARVAELPVDIDVEAMAVIANVWRAAQEARAQLERRVLRPEGVSWGGFSLLFNLWIAGPDHPMETRALAASIG